MEKEILQYFNEEVLSLGANRFGIKLEELKHLGNWQNFIYEYMKENQLFILRFTPSLHRCMSSVKGEVDWLLYLSKNGISVSPPIQSAHGNFVEVIERDAVSFIVTSFVKAKGAKIEYPEILNDTDTYYKLGKMTGRIHALSKKYSPAEPVIKRHHWDQNYYIMNLQKFIPEQHEVIDACTSLVSTIKNNLPLDEKSYGLIHGDIGNGNFLVDEDGIITLFDFDEAQYSWFVEDIAIPLYYLVYVYGGEEGKALRESQAQLFMEHFLKGYQLENFFDDQWLKYIPLFLQLREIIVYGGCHRSWDFSNLNQWRIDWLKESKDRIENNEPIVNIW
jgi:amicoumacin kinase